MGEQAIQPYISISSIIRKLRYFVFVVPIVFLKMSLPAFFDKGHVVADILHSGAIWWSLIPLALLIPFIAGAGSDKARLFRVAGTAVSLVMVAISFNAWSTYTAESRIAQRGVATVGHVDRLLAGTCSRHGCSTVVEYSFRPRMSDTSIVAYEDVGYDIQSRREIAVSRVVPVTYDQQDPHVSKIGSEDTASSLNFYRNVLAVSGSALAISLLILVPLFVIAQRDPAKMKEAAVPD